MVHGGGTITLADGTSLWVRQLRLDDRDALTDLYDRLGEQSRYQRFFACPPRLPSSWADRLLERCPRRLGLVAGPIGKPHHIVALADGTASTDGACAEVGLVVEDAWQHNGLGRALFERLLMLAERRGVRVFVAYVEWGNVRVVQGLHRCTAIVDRTMDAGVLKLTFTRQKRHPRSIRT